MLCPLCKYPKSSVEKTLKFMTLYRRLRRCKNPTCRKYWFSNETVDPNMIFDEPPIDDTEEVEETEDEKEDEKEPKKEPDLFSQN